MRDPSALKAPLPLETTASRSASRDGLAGVKILLVSRCAWTLFNFRSGLVRALLDHQAVVIAGGSADDGFGPRVEALGTRFVDLPVDRRGTSLVGDLRLLIRLFLWYRRERPQVVHHFTIKPVIYGSIAARLAGVPCIVNTVTGLGHVFLNEDRPLLRFLVERLYWLAMRCADFNFFQNRDDRALFLERRLAPANRTGLVPGSGVDCQAFRPGPTDPDLAHTTTILMVARLLREKGIYEFVDAARVVRRGHPSVRFAILGRRDERNPSVVPEAELAAWQAEGVIEWLGEVEDVRPHLQAADIVVLPSYREGTPRALLEAAAMAKPIVTTDTAGCREVVEHGRTGLLVPVQDAGALAAAIDDLIRDPDKRRRMGAAGRTKVERDFDERLVIESTLAAYHPDSGRQPTAAITT